MYKIFLLALLVSVAAASFDYTGAPAAGHGYDYGYGGAADYGYGYPAAGYTGSYGGDSFYLLYKKYSTSYSSYFYNYCNTYLSSHPRGRYASYAQRYIATYRSQYAGGCSSGYGYGGDYSSTSFYSLYQRCSTSYSKYFYDFCNTYLSTHPRGRYASYAQRYLATYRSQYSSVSSCSSGYGYGGDYSSTSFYSLYQRCSTSYSKYFYDFCNKYLQLHPTGRYVSFARQYLSSYYNQYSSVSSCSSGYGYGRDYSSTSFYSLYQRCSTSYSKYFYDFCNTYLSTHPRGRYASYAQRYLSTYRSQYSSVSSCSSGYGYGRDYSSTSFYSLYQRCSTSYSKYFYDFCNKYLQLHPTGRYVSIARQYLSTYYNQYSSVRTGYGYSSGNYGYGYAGAAPVAYSAEPAYNAGYGYPSGDSYPHGSNY